MKDTQEGSWYLLLNKKISGFQQKDMEGFDLNTEQVFRVNKQLPPGYSFEKTASRPQCLQRECAHTQE